MVKFLKVIDDLIVRSFTLGKSLVEKRSGR